MNVLREENKRRHRAAMGITEDVKPVVARTPRTLKPALKWNGHYGTCLPRAIRFPGSLDRELNAIRKAYKKGGIEEAYNVARKIG